MNLEQRVEDLEKRLAAVEKKLGMTLSEDGYVQRSTWNQNSVPKRLSIPMPKLGMRRPVVLSLQKMFHTNLTGAFDSDLDTIIRAFQRDNGLVDDGVIGPNTWKAILEQKDCPPLEMRVYEWVATVETGSRQNSFGMAEADIGDSAGANYGVIQYNSRGSMTRLLKSAGKEDLLHLYETHDDSAPVFEIKEWIGSYEGIQAQVKDFRRVIFIPAVGMASDLISNIHRGIDDQLKERLICLMADIRVQNGSLYSPYRGPIEHLLRKYFAAEIGELIDDPQALANQVLKVFDETKGDASEKNRQAIGVLVDRLLASGHVDAVAPAVAVYRGACSKKRWAGRVIQRKLVIARGEGEVHGYKISMYDDFGIGTSVSDGE